MIIDGERVRALLGSAHTTALLCAPFIKARALRVLLDAIPTRVGVRVITRWRAEEVAVGVSDLEVFDIVQGRPDAQLFLLDNLHAKLYLADDDGLVGSANVSASALGWAKRNNIEILVPVTREGPEVRALLHDLCAAVPATAAFRDALASQAEKLVTPKLGDGSEISGDESLREVVWLPRCAMPGKLYEVYADAEYSAVVDDTRADALADLRDLNPPDRLDQEAFTRVIRDRLRLLPAFHAVLDRASGRITDEEGNAAVASLRPSLSRGQRSHQWRIVREWIGVFFGEEFEVAPQSFVLRPKRRSG